MLFHTVMGDAATLTSFVLCLWLLGPTLRFLFPRLVVFAVHWGLPRRFDEWKRPKRHDALMAASFLLTLNRVWLGLRPVIFGRRFETFERMEIPYLDAALAWAIISVLCLALVLRGYRKQK